MKKLNIINTIKDKQLNETLKTIQEKCGSYLTQFVVNIKAIEEDFLNRFDVHHINYQLIIIDNLTQEYCIINYYDNKSSVYFKVIDNLNIIYDTENNKLYHFINMWKHIQISNDALKLLENEILCFKKSSEFSKYYNFKFSKNGITIIDLNSKNNAYIISKNNPYIKSYDVAPKIELLLTNYLDYFEEFKTRVKFELLYKQTILDLNKELNEFEIIFNTIVFLVEKTSDNKIRNLSTAIHLLVNNFNMFSKVFDYNSIQKKHIETYGLSALILIHKSENGN